MGASPILVLTQSGRGRKTKFDVLFDNVTRTIKGALSDLQQ